MLYEPLRYLWQLIATHGLYLVVPTTSALMSLLRGKPSPIRAGKFVLLSFIVLEVSMVPTRLLRALIAGGANLVLLTSLLPLTTMVRDITFRVASTLPIVAIPFDMDVRMGVSMHPLALFIIRFIRISLLIPIAGAYGVLTRRSTGSAIALGVGTCPIRTLPARPLREISILFSIPPIGPTTLECTYSFFPIVPLTPRSPGTMVSNTSFAMVFAIRVDKRSIGVQFTIDLLEITTVVIENRFVPRVKVDKTFTLTHFVPPENSNNKHTIRASSILFVSDTKNVAVLCARKINSDPKSAIDSVGTSLNLEVVNTIVTPEKFVPVLGGTNVVAGTSFLRNESATVIVVVTFANVVPHDPAPATPTLTRNYAHTPGSVSHVHDRPKWYVYGIPFCVV